MEITNKVTIVTGGLGGIGFSTVQHFLKNGAEFVAIFDIFETNHERVTNSLKVLEKQFKKEKYEYYTCDVKNTKDFEAAYDKVTKHKKYVDILVNNAAVANDRDIDLSIDVNFRAVVHGTMMAVERMGKHKGFKGGVIVNIASFLGLINEPLAPVYNATKHAVVSFVQSMKYHNETLGVRIVCICPGMTKTNMVDFDAFRRDLFEFVPTDKIQQALDIYMQSPDNVASAIMEIIRKGKGGDVWLAENDQPPVAIGIETDLEKMRISF